jgi:Mn-containing catalase
MLLREQCSLIPPANASEAAGMWRDFTAALESMGKQPFTIGRIAPTPKLVDQFFNDSTGNGTTEKSIPADPGTKGQDGNSCNLPRSRSTSDAVADPENAAASIHTESTGFGDNALEELL